MSISRMSMRPSSIHSLLFIALALLAREACAQIPAPPADTSDPSIVVLMPGRVDVAGAIAAKKKKADAEYRDANDKGIAQARQQIQELRNNPERLAAMDSARRERILKSELAFDDVAKSVKQFGVVSLLSYGSESYITYLLHERFPGLSVHAVADSSTLDAGALSRIALRTGSHFVLTFPSVRFDAHGANPFAMVRGALYDSRTGSFLFDTTVVGDPDNHGFATTCSPGLQCTMVNALGYFSTATALAVMDNSPKVRYAANIARLRSGILMERYYGRPCAQRVIDLIPRDSTLPDISALYACFANSDTTQVVAFMAESTERRMFDKKERYGDRNIKIEQDFKDFDHVSNIYAFILTGALVDGVWRFGKQDVTYMSDSTLEAGRRTFFVAGLLHHNFFADGGIEPGAAFWTSGLFERVEDPRLLKGFDSESPYYRNMLEADKDYIGMYRFVAEKLRSER
jgi:hypothetical protein